MKKILILLLLVIATSAVAQGPNDSGDYYKAADGQKGQALKTALHNIIKIKASGWTYDELKEAYTTTDKRPDGYLRDWYSNATYYTPGSPLAGGTSAEGQGYNREHLVPQSWFKEATPMKSDIFHVVPTDAKINNNRGSDPLGEVGSSYSQSKNGYSKWGMARSGLGYSGQVFEPNDEVKGDIARAYFYMVTCYEDKISNWNASGKSYYVFDGNSYPGLTDWTLQMMIRWSALDPVDDIEVARNNVISEKQNRNPFIDYPGLEEYIWGTKTSEPFDYTMEMGGDIPSVRKPYFTPTGGTYYEPVEVAIVSPTDGATVYYTTDGTTPTTASNVYAGPITIEATTTLMAMAAKDDVVSHVAVATYVITDEEPQPDGDYIWREDFTGAGNQTPVEQVKNDKAVYHGDDGQYCKTYDGNMAGGTAPELLIPRTSRPINYFTATIALSGQKSPYHLSFMSNRSTIEVTSKTAGVTIKAEQADGNTYHYTVTAPDGIKSIELKFSTTEDSNARIDNLQLQVISDGVKLPTTSPDTHHPVFNLSGQQLPTPKRGVVIANGKKIIVK